MFLIYERGVTSTSSSNIFILKKTTKTNIRNKVVNLKYLDLIYTYYIDTLVYFILIKNLKEFLHLVSWLCFVVQGKLAAI